MIKTEELCAGADWLRWWVSDPLLGLGKIWAA